MKVWKYVYKDSVIEVKNSALKVELIVNNSLQDMRKGMVAPSHPLTGKLETGEEIKAIIDGNLKIGCTLFIDNALQEPVNKD